MTIHTVMDGIAEIRWRNPPVDSLSLAVRRQIRDALVAALADPQVTAVILAGSGDNFSGGADIREFGTADAEAEPDLVAIERLCDESGKPVVAAIAGVALGGGLEIALAAHHRVSTPAARLGLPEVKLGILPGAGGTQRLPRLVGVDRAIAMMTSGSPVSGEEASTFGLVDRLADDPVAAARAFVGELLAQAAPLRRARDQPADVGTDPAAYFARARTIVERAARGAPAPGRIVDCVEAATTRSFEEGLAFERRCFDELAATPQSLALRHVFFAERAAARIDDLPTGTPVRPIATVGVVGAGTMGTGIAMAFANGGFGICLFDADADALARASSRIRDTYESSAARGRVSRGEADTRLARIDFVDAIESLAGADLVIEAVFEDMAVKRAVFARLDAVAKPGCILATNTSFLDVDALAAGTKRPQDVIGLHFFSPANIMRLLEVVRGRATAPDVLATAMSLARRIGKVAVVSRVCDGFIGNRMVERYMLRALELVAAGASPTEVDSAMERFGMAMGPFAMSDLAGNDIAWLDRKRRIARDQSYRSPGFADEMCERGWYGQKTGRGWYRYEPGGRGRQPHPEVDHLIADWRARNGIEPRSVPSEEVVERCLFALANEGAKLLDEGIAQRASDIDTVYVAGYGFPAHKGGPMHAAEAIGLDHMRVCLTRWQAEAPELDWAPAALVTRGAANGRFAA